MSENASQLLVESVAEGYIALRFVNRGEVVAEHIIQYPRQGEMVRYEGQPSRTTVRVSKLQEALEPFNEILRAWAS